VIQEALEQQVRRVRRAILVRRVRAAVQDLTELREILDRLGTMDPRDPQVHEARPVIQAMMEQLEARAQQARRDLLGIEESPGQLATQVRPVWATRVRRGTLDPPV